MCSLTLGESEVYLAVGTHAVNVGLTVTEAVLLKLKEALDLAPYRHKYLIFTLSFVYIL